MKKNLHEFYEKVFLWGITVKGPGYALVQTPAATVSGAIIDTETPSLIIGVSVANLDETLAAVVSSGGSVVMPKTDNGWVVKAQVADPVGNKITLVQV